VRVDLFGLLENNFGEQAFALAEEVKGRLAPPTIRSLPQLLPVVDQEIGKCLLTTLLLDDLLLDHE
jgi:hypothetical protein